MATCEGWTPWPSCSVRPPPYGEEATLVSKPGAAAWAGAVAEALAASIAPTEIADIVVRITSNMALGPRSRHRPGI